MAWDIRSTYYYLVCFVTLMILIFASASFAMNTLDIVLPDEPVKPTREDMAVRTRTEAGGVASQPYSAAQLDSLAQVQVDAEVRRARRYAIKQLLYNIVLLGIALPVFLSHKRQIRGLERPKGSVA